MPVFSDVFSDADNTDLSTHDPTNWGDHGTSSDNAEVIDNAAAVAHTITGSSYSVAYYKIAMTNANYTISSTIKTYTAGSDGVAALAGRLDSTSVYNAYEADYYDATASGSRAVRLIRRGTGAGTAVLGSYTFNAGSSASFTMDLMLKGSSLSVYKDGVLVIGPVTDTNLASAGYVGLRLGNQSAGNAANVPRVDSLTITTPSGVLRPPGFRAVSGLYIR